MYRNEGSQNVTQGTLTYQQRGRFYTVNFDVTTWPSFNWLMQSAMQNVQLKNKLAKRNLELLKLRKKAFICQISFLIKYSILCFIRYECELSLLISEIVSMSTSFSIHFCHTVENYASLEFLDTAFFS